MILRYYSFTYYLFFVLLYRGVDLSNESRKRKRTNTEIFETLPKTLVIYINDKEYSSYEYPISPEFVIDLKDFYVGESLFTKYGKYFSK